MSFDKTNTENLPQPDMTEPTMPTVSMNIGLGAYVREGQVIDFDYDAYQSVAHDMGLSDEAIDRLQIQLGERRLGSALGNMGYDGETPGIRVGFNRGIFNGTKRSLNNTLAHETQHYADIASGEVAKMTPDSYQRARKVNPVATKLLWLGNLLWGASEVAGKPALMIASTSLQVPGLLGLGYAMKNYVRDPSEVRARKAGRQYKKSGMLGVNKKTDSLQSA